MEEKVYTFDYQVTAMDIWKVSMYNMYHSMVGCVNVVFTVAMILLAQKFWFQVNPFFKIALIFGMALFTIIQPWSIYYKAKGIVAKMPKNMKISFSEIGIKIKASPEVTEISWKAVSRVISLSSMLIIKIVNAQGIVLTNVVLENDKDILYTYIQSKMSESL